MNSASRRSSRENRREFESDSAMALVITRAIDIGNMMPIPLLC